MKTDKQNNWYAIRVPYGREMKLKRLLDTLEVKCFVPMTYKKKELKGKSQNFLVPAIHNLIFVYSTREFLNELKTQLEYSVPFRYIMDKATDSPAVVPCQEMEQFIAVAGTLDEQLIYLTHIDPTLKSGDKVQVVGGIFEGIKGIVVRIKKDRRVMVSINNFVAVATAHINPLLLKKIEF